MRHDGDRTTDRTMRFTVPQAAGVMGISAEAVPQRIKRGTLTTEKDENGTVFVLLKADESRTNAERTHPNDDRTSDITADSTALVEELRDRVLSLESQLSEERTANRENRRLLAAALERIPALEEALQGRETPPRRPARSAMAVAGPPGQEKPASWLRRLFGA